MQPKIDEIINWSNNCSDLKMLNDGKIDWEKSLSAVKSSMLFSLPKSTKNIPPTPTSPAVTVDSLTV